LAFPVTAPKHPRERAHETSGKTLAPPGPIGFLETCVRFWAPKPSAAVGGPGRYAILVRRAFAARLILARPVTAVLAFGAADATALAGASTALPAGFYAHPVTAVLVLVATGVGTLAVAFLAFGAG
jgi:hypothetical protein